MLCRNLCNLYSTASMESCLSKWLPYYHRTHLQASLTTAQLFLTSDPDAVTYDSTCLSRTTSVNSLYGRKAPRQHIRDREERLLHWRVEGKKNTGSQTASAQPHCQFDGAILMRKRCYCLQISYFIIYCLTHLSNQPVISHTHC